MNTKDKKNRKLTKILDEIYAAYSRDELDFEMAIATVGVMAYRLGLDTMNEKANLLAMYYITPTPMNTDINTIRRNTFITGEQPIQPIMKITKDCIDIVRLDAFGEDALNNGSAPRPVLYNDPDKTNQYLTRIVTHAYIEGIRAERARRKKRGKHDRTIQ